MSICNGSGSVPVCVCVGLWYQGCQGACEGCERVTEPVLLVEVVGLGASVGWIVEAVVLAWPVLFVRWGVVGVRVAGAVRGLWLRLWVGGGVSGPFCFCPPTVEMICTVKGGSFGFFGRLLDLLGFLRFG